MRKAIFAVLIVALAMLATTCDSAVLPANLSSGQGPGAAAEPEWTTISINVGDSNGRARAMNRAQNMGSEDLYEVVFSYNSGAITVRDTLAKVSGNFPTSWTVTVPKANYTAGNNTAVLFAGQSGTPNILIATGERTGGGNFTGTDTTITFTLSAITSGVSGTKANSSFAYTEDTLVLNPATLNTMTAETLANVPYYKIIEGSTAINATYKFNNLKPGVVISAAGTVTPTGVSVPGPAASVSVGAVTPNSGALTLVSGTATFSFTITPGTGLGYSKISIAVPVYALNTSFHTSQGKPSYVAWSLQGGLANTTIDTGSNTGGAVLLEVEAEPTGEIAISKTTSSTAMGWEWGTAPANANRWTFSQEMKETIALTATPAFFTPNSYTWKISADGSVDAGDPTLLATIADATGTITANITIPSTSTYWNGKTTGHEFWVYCIAGPGDVESDNMIHVVVQEQFFGQGVDITLPPTWTNP